MRTPFFTRLFVLSLITAMALPMVARAADDDSVDAIAKAVEEQPAFRNKLNHFETRVKHVAEELAAKTAEIKSLRSRVMRDLEKNLSEKLPTMNPIQAALEAEMIAQRTKRIEHLKKARNGGVYREQAEAYFKPLQDEAKVRSNKLGKLYQEGSFLGSEQRLALAKDAGMSDDLAKLYSTADQHAAEKILRDLDKLTRADLQIYKQAQEGPNSWQSFQEQLYTLEKESAEGISASKTALTETQKNRELVDKLKQVDEVLLTKGTADLKKAEELLTKVKMEAKFANESTRHLFGQREEIINFYKGGEGALDSLKRNSSVSHNTQYNLVKLVEAEKDAISIERRLAMAEGKVNTWKEFLGTLGKGKTLGIAFGTLGGLIVLDNARQVYGATLPGRKAPAIVDHADEDSAQAKASAGGQ